MRRVLVIPLALVLLAGAAGACGGASDGGDGGGASDLGGGGDVWVGRQDTASVPGGEDGGAAPDGRADVRPDARTDVRADGAGDAADALRDALADGGDTAGDAVPDARPDAADGGGAPDIGTIECGTDADCELALPFHDRCERVWCEEGRCRIAPIQDCCRADGDCFDWDPCTVDRCSETSRQCENAPSGDPTCCSGAWPLQADFEGGLPAGWELERPEGARAYWHVSTVRAAAGARSLVFLEPESGGYGTGYHEYGDARGPWIDVPVDAERPLLRFHLYLDTEWRLYGGAWADPSPLVYDRLTVLLEDADGAAEVWTSYSPDVRGHTCADGCGFRAFTVDLGDVRGHRVRPIFRFDSGDHVDNDWSGAAIDNVGVELACGPPPECYTSTDCDDGDRCTDDTCVEGACVAAPNYAPGCCYDWEQQSWQFDPFSLSGFQVQPSDPIVRWHVSDRRAATGSASLRFGSVVNDGYALSGEPVSGRAISPSVLLASWVTTTLNLSVWVDVEPWDETQPGRDAFEIGILRPGDGSFEVVWSRQSLAPAQYRTWVPIEIPLTAWAGDIVIVRFQFASGDGEENDGEGVYVDDVRLIRRCY